MANTKRALLTSALAIVACVAMLIGSTFAWFTDTASTGVNKIQAGNLDIELAYKNAKTEGNFKEAKADTKVFDESALWEPGYVEYVVLKISNAGNLALKYQLGINIAGEKESTNVYGDTFKLSDYIRFAVIDGDKIEDGTNRDDLLTAAGEGTVLNKGYTSEEDHLDKKGDEKIVTLVVWMPTTVGNEANHRTDAAAPSIDLGIKVYATQYTYESDSFDDQYDAKATYYPVLDQAGLKDALAAGGEVKLDKDVATDALLIAKKSATLDLGGKTIANTADIWNESTMAWSLISARGKDTTLTVTGNGTLKAKENDNFAIDVQDGATVIVKDGTFIGNIHAVYVYEGTAIIEGGFFSVQQKYPDAAKANEFVLNCYDANRADGKAKITVTGGTFVNFNPADCQAEGAGTSFVPAGYTVVTEKKANGDTWYTVVSTSNADGLKDVLAKGGELTVSDEIRIDKVEDTADARVIIAKPTTLDLNAKIVTPDNMGNNDSNFCALIVDADTTINAGENGGIDTGKNGGYGINVRKGATLTINGGSYYGGGTTVQVQEGTLIINGGKFACEPYDNPVYGYKFLINCIDAAWKDGTAKVIIKGGTFINFDPSDSASENPHGNFVADGYKVTSEKQANGDIWYTVVKA